MLKKIILLLLISSTTIVFAQNSTEKELKLIETPEQIESFLASKKSRKNKVVTFNEEKHKTVLAKKLFKLNVGSTKIIESEFQKTFYKVIKKTRDTYHRVSYIYLNGSTYKLNELNALRAKIIKSYNEGTSFDILARKYSMDATAYKGGDLGWFSNGKMHPDFEQEVMRYSHDVKDIFTLDIPSKNQYFVVLKTHEPKEILAIDVLKIVEPLR